MIFFKQKYDEFFFLIHSITHIIYSSYYTMDLILSIIILTFYITYFNSCILNDKYNITILLFNKKNLKLNINKKIIN